MNFSTQTRLSFNNKHIHKIKLTPQGCLEVFLLTRRLFPFHGHNVGSFGSSKKSVVSVGEITSGSNKLWQFV